jgi:hypothetical protein
MQMQRSQLDIAPTIAKLLNIEYTADGDPIEEIVEEFSGDFDEIVLLIVDSLGFNIYTDYLHNFEYLSLSLSEDMERRREQKREAEEMVFKLKSVARYTTPCIASIFTGKKPEKHRMFSTDDAYETHLKSILEVATEKGYKTGIVMERRGALSFKDKLSFVVPVDNREEIISFDEETVEGVLKTFLKTDLLVAHLRTIDVINDYEYSTKIMNGFLRRIGEKFTRSGRRGLFFICGDHPVHTDMSEENVALLVFRS